MFNSVLAPEDLSTLKYLVTHVFCPLQLPDGDDHSISKDRSLATAIASVSRLFSDHADQGSVLQWHSISRMLGNLQVITQSQGLDQSQITSLLKKMKIGDVVSFPIRAQNAAVIFRKQKLVTVFESFEVSPKAHHVMTSQGKLICSYPGPAIDIPNDVFSDGNFLSELANFLVHMNEDVLDAAATTRKAHSTVLETRDTAHPRYITELLTGILRSVGRPAETVRITKRVGDDVTWKNSKLPWRRSPLWLLIRVVVQTSLDRSSFGYNTYKEFMLFFMCRLAKEGLCAHLPNDLVHSMSSKISRRLKKLGSSTPDWLSNMVLQTCTSLRSILNERWGSVQASQRISPSWNPSEFNLTSDIQLSLLSSGDHIQRALASVGVKPSGVTFQPKHHQRGTLGNFLSSSGFFDAAYCSEPYVTLYDVERAVEQGIDNWVDSVTSNNEACVKLETLANKYSLSAIKTYPKNPELLSVMLLTTIELWVALDKLAVREIPMLVDYSPEVPTQILEDLLLYKAANLGRLRQAHQYLSRRHSQSRPGWSVFSSPSVDAFAVRFYRGSSHLQGLKARIEENAQKEVCKKVAELEKLNSRYSELQQQAAKLDHEYYIDWYGNRSHGKRCQKCGLENQKIDIAIHEWPLPTNQVQAEAVVFELDCPVSFNMWRSATFHLLVELCSPSIKTTSPYIKLSDYAALRSYLQQHPRSRITLASDTKPFVVTHYKTRRIPTTQKDICVKNGLTYYGFDRNARIPVSGALSHVDIGRYCKYEPHEPQSSPYQQLQKYMHTTSHTSNEIVANQTDCPANLSIHEFLAFGHLRSGGILQWLNILRELRARSLSFRRQEIHFLLAHAVSQVGPLDNAGRWTWHQVLQDPSFCNALLGELGTLIQDVEANWLEAVTMETISFLLRRLLASSPDEMICKKAFGLLRTVRSKVFTWMKELSNKLAKTPGDNECRGYLRDTAAICRSTFDVDLPMIRNVLCSPEDVCILLYSAALIHDHTPSKVGCLSAHSRLLLNRDQRLSLALEDVLSNLVQEDSSDEGIDSAIGMIWFGYRPGSKWSSLSGPNSRWFSCRTAETSTPQESSQKVHFNLLDGSLLVDGKPLGRLPNEILRHPLHNQLFGEQILDVVPADVSGMDYSTRGEIFGHQVYFSLRGNGSDLVIQAKRMELPPDRPSGIMELIPREKLRGDLPDLLIDGHVHWLNLASSIMEIRPLTSLWETSSENWKINCIIGQYRASRGDEYLVDIRSKSWDVVSNLLKPLDTPRNLLVTVSPTNADNPPLQLSVDLPRYSLSFHVDEDGELQCRTIRGMVYDENQSAGTMFGLVNQLVLRPKLRNGKGADLNPRCILVPDGTVSFCQVNHHVSVKINTGGSALQSLTYQMYTVDTDLGCLTGNGSLTDKLYCVYLHALTSGCGTDPLTGRSGTEEALSLLRSAGCWSIMRLGPRDTELLESIASISPSRSWYPKHLTCMQKVEWRDLPTSSQHHEFLTIAKGIKEHYERLQLFQGCQSTSSGSFDEFPSQEEHLLRRSALRAAYLSPFEFAGQPSESDFDVKYAARDRVTGDSGEHRAYMAASTVYSRTTNTTNINVLKMAESWTRVSGDTVLSLHYGKSWLGPNLPSIWLTAYNLLRKDEEAKWWYMLFSLPAMVYSSPQHNDLVPLLVTFASCPQFRFESPPRYDSYVLSDGYHPSRNTLRNYVSCSATRFEDSPESSESANKDERLHELRRRQREAYNTRLESDTVATVEPLLRAWPCEKPPHCSLKRNLYNVTSFTSNVQDHFATCYRNLKLKEHLDRVQKILDGVPSKAVPTPTKYSFEPSQSVSTSMPWILNIDQLFSRDTPLLREHNKLPLYAAKASGTPQSSFVSLNKLIATAEANVGNVFQRTYVSALRTSATYFGNNVPPVTRVSTQLPDTQVLEGHYIHCKENYSNALRHLAQLLGPRSRSEQALEQAGQWPRITTRSLLRCLASNSSIALSDDWKKCLVQLALLVLELQRARRLLRLLLDDLPEDLRNELQNEGCDGWDAEAHPDWLLIQLQGNFFIRRVQAEVANEMISPSSGENTAMQLNMGEGKSSVIVPIAVAILADGDQLVRVIVPKALTAQMFQILVDRLGGLTNRRVYHLPFSRSFQVDHQKVAALRGLMSECMKERGILVVQPEHVLSLKLVSVEKQLLQGAERHTALPLLGLQKWLHSRSRDILDESDEILHVRYQLVYTMGQQQAMEGFRERWTTTQQVLDLVQRRASSLQKLFPLGVEYERGPSGSFPHLRILQQSAGEKLISLIVQDVMDGHLLNFNLGQLRSEMRRAIRSFISCDNVPLEVVQLIKDYSHQWSGLLLLRGLLATGILLFALRERRWRVDYGLDPTRTMLAVPYRAKDVPAQRAEFGHPDIAIILTCLSYYYRGLTEVELKLCFEILLKQDDPSLDYDSWVQDCNVPDSFRTLSGVNLKSSEQWEVQLLPLFRWNRATIDFYLSNVVFPKEAKEFPSKLSCSGWDLAEKKERLLTGFSGTNDGQYLLPLHITQRDPDHQRGTNAKVLSYLLQPENNHYQCMTHENGERRTTSEFLKILSEQKPEIRVLLDVGAQMLELENLPLAKAWLDVDTRVSAAIYFNKDDELTVLTRDGRTQPLISSPFAQQLDRCVTYLDDAHTRGTNIKFPTGFRAAVTLGPKVTKDRLAQGCMRMRKLGHGHSIKFFAPLEVDWRIRSVARKDARDTIDTLDILLWTIDETCKDIQQRVPHWAQQGTDHTSRYAAWTRFCRDEATSGELSNEWLQPEAKKLEELYGPQGLNPTWLADSDIRERCVRLGVLKLRDVSMDEEQEREVIHEAERERQVERPPKAPPAVHSLHPDVTAFVKTGVIPSGSQAFRSAFDVLAATSAVIDEAPIWSANLLVTIDFEKTINPPGMTTSGSKKKKKNTNRLSETTLGEFLRPVQWIISGERANRNALVILSPFEAARLMPEIKSSGNVRLHVYTPRIFKTMKPCDDLTLYSVPLATTGLNTPPLLMDQLNVFAGQLYLKDYETYIRLCRFLCVYARDLKDEENIQVESDGFIAPNNRPEHLRSVYTFRRSPLSSVRALMALRRKGMRFTPTHMGRLLDGRLLSESDFEDD